MRSNGIIRFALLSLLAMSLYSCIYDKYPGRAQYDLTVEYVDSEDNKLPDSVATLDRVGCFVDGIYKETLVEEEDGKYRYAFTEGDNIAFVAIAGEKPDEYAIYPPKPGVAISNCWLQMNLTPGKETPEPSAVYYGSIHTILTGTSNERVVIRMHDVRSKVRIIARNFLDKFGYGNYRFTIENCRSGISYDGKGCGSFVNYEMPGSIHSDGDYYTTTRTIFPTDDIPLRVKIYKEDGSLLFDRDTDEDGNPLIIHSGTDEVILIMFYYYTDAAIRVVPFEDIQNSTIFP